MKNRLFAFLAAAVMSAFAHAGESGTWTDWNGVTWKFSYTDSDYTAEITGASGYSDTLEIPQTVSVGSDKYRVTAIGNFAFPALANPLLEGIKSVTISANVQTIGEGAFMGGNFTSLTIKSDLNLWIGRCAFTSPLSCLRACSCRCSPKACTWEQE